MSIYATIDVFTVYPNGCYEPENGVQVWVQAVPVHIDYTGAMWDFLLPVEQSGPRFRSLFILHDDTEKGTDRCGQEYQSWLMQLSEEEYYSTPFPELLQRIEIAVFGEGA